MRLVTYSSGVVDSTTSGGTDERIGVIVEGGVVDLLDAARAVGGSDNPALDDRQRNAGREIAGILEGTCDGPMMRLLKQWGGAAPAIDAVRSALAADPELVERRQLDESRLLAPVPRPASMRDGYAFRQHVEAARRNRGVEMIPEFDQFPVFYFTNHGAVTGPGEVRVRDGHLDRLDFELECAIVVGREGRDISAAEADDYIAGYMIMNDWSARAMQMEEMKLSLGPAKGKDFATSIGPMLVTRDELAPKRVEGDAGERFDLTMVTRVNGEEVSRGNLRDMTWTFGQILERVSYGATIYPGDVIGSGTVGTGCFLELNGSKITDNWWLKDGDVVECEIEELGTLRNRVVRYEP